MKWITLLFISLIFINLFVHSLSQFKFNAFSFIKLFADLEFGQVETIVHRYKSTTDEYQYNKLKCLKQLKVLKNDVMNGKTWALKSKLNFIDNGFGLINSIFQLLMPGVKFHPDYCR